MLRGLKDQSLDWKFYCGIQAKHLITNTLYGPDILLTLDIEAYLAFKCQFNPKQITKEILLNLCYKWDKKTLDQSYH